MNKWLFGVKLLPYPSKDKKEKGNSGKKSSLPFISLGNRYFPYIISFKSEHTRSPISCYIAWDLVQCLPHNLINAK